MAKKVYKEGDQVWVRMSGSDAWVQGEVVGNTAKRVKVYNEVRGLVGLYTPSNVKERV